MRSARLGPAVLARYITAMAKTADKPLDALDFLASPGKHPPLPVCVLFGDESFLKRQVLGQLKEIVLSGDDAEFSVSAFDRREPCSAAAGIW
jgi:hypothetical protein